MAHSSSVGHVVEWLVIAVIAVFVLPRVVSMLFDGFGNSAAGTARFVIDTDPTAAADANLAAAINATGGYGW